MRRYLGMVNGVVKSGIGIYLPSQRTDPVGNRGSGIIPAPLKKHMFQKMRQPASQILLFMNTAGTDMTLQLHRRLPGTVKVVQVEDYRGQKDANDLLRACGPEAVRHAVQNAKPVPMRHIKRLADVKSVDLRTLPHIVTGLPPLDRVIGGLYFGQVALLTGKRGEGKSTLMGQLVAEALNQRYRVLAYSGELPDYHFRRWLDLQLAGPRHVVTRQNRFSDPCYDLSPETVEKLGAWYHDRAFLYDNNALDEGDETDSLLHTLEKAVRRYGIELMNGQSAGMILAAFLLEILLVIAAAMIFTVWKFMDLIRLNPVFLLVILALALFSVLIVSVIFIRRLLKVDIEEIIRSEE